MKQQISVKLRNDEVQICFPLSLCSAVHLLGQYQSELCELSHLAWRGLEGNKTLFMEEDISQDVLTFTVGTGIFSQVRRGLCDM